MAIVLDRKELAHRIGLLLRQRLAHVQPVRADHRLQRAEFVRQFLRAPWTDQWNMQLVEETTQRGARRKLGAQFALILNLQTMLEQISDHLPVMRILEEAVDLMRDFQANIRQVRQHLRQGLLHPLQRTQGACQHLGCLLADIRNPEGVDESRQARVLAVFYGTEQLVARYLGKTFKIDNVFELERVEIGRRTYQALIHQLLDTLVAQTFDVHRTSRHEVNDRLLQLRTAGKTPDAAIHRAFADRLAAFAALDQLRALDMGTAHRALLGNLHRPGVFRTTLHDHLHHLRNHVTGTADDHRVADHQAQARDFVHVVQRGVGHRDARDLDRFQTRHRRHRPGAADLEFHIEQLGEFFHRREFVGDGPTRLTGAKAQFALGGNAVDLEYDAVDFIRQRTATLTDVAVVIQALGDAVRQFQLMTDRHAPGLELLQIADVRIGDVRRHLADAVAAELQRAIGGDLRVQLAQTARRRVARVGEGLAADFQLRGVEPLETGLGHEHFAAHFQGRRPAAAVQLERDVAYGAHVDADVFARRTVAAGGAAHQDAILVQQADGQAIELGLAAVFDGCAATEQVARRQVQAFGHPAVELTHVGFFEGVAEAEHRHFVTHLGKRRQRRAAHSLGRRVAGDQFGIGRFQRLELVEQAVVLGVRNARLVEHVVTIVVLIQLSAQL
ncbi:hypothetical protein D3C76_705020 [compost metagenome]